MVHELILRVEVPDGTELTEDQLAWFGASVMEKLVSPRSIYTAEDVPSGISFSTAKVAEPVSVHGDLAEQDPPNPGTEQETESPE